VCTKCGLSPGPGVPSVGGKKTWTCLATLLDTNPLFAFLVLT
jgi:hypothetical protein